jgi:hypothetical protein
VRLDRGFRHIELISDLLVQKPLGQHAENPRLLRRQRLQPVDEIVHLRIALDTQLYALRHHDVARKNAVHRCSNGIDAGRFGDEARRAKLHRAADGHRIVMGRNDDDRHVGIDAAKRNKS